MGDNVTSTLVEKKGTDDRADCVGRRKGGSLYPEAADIVQLERQNCGFEGSKAVTVAYNR